MTLRIYKDECVCVCLPKLIRAQKWRQLFNCVYCECSESKNKIIQVYCWKWKTDYLSACLTLCGHWWFEAKAYTARPQSFFWLPTCSLLPIQRLSHALYDHICVCVCKINTKKVLSLFYQWICHSALTICWLVNDNFIALEQEWQQLERVRVTFFEYIHTRMRIRECM